MSRLPHPGGDDGTWGDILNDFLLQIHNSNGTLKNGLVTASKLSASNGTTGQVLTKDTTVNGGLKWDVGPTSGTPTGPAGGDLSGTYPDPTIAAGVITTSKINDGDVTEAKLSNAVQTKLNAQDDVTSVAGRTGDVVLTKSDVGLNNVDNTSDATKNSATATFTNKRRQPRVFSTASTATLTPEIDTYDVFHLTAQAAALTIANHSTSTPADGEQMRIRILDNGTARSISFGTNYVAKGGIALPTTTTQSKNMEMGFEWNANLSKWNLLALAQEA